MKSTLVTHLLTLIRRGDSQEIEAARDRVSPEIMPELLDAYWSLDSWEQRTALLHLCSDHLVPGGQRVMRHYLTTPQTDDPATWSKIVALCQLAGTWELYERLWDDRDLLEAAIERALAGETPSLEGLDRLQSASRSTPQAQKQPTGGVDHEVAELLEIARRGDVVEVEESRLRVQPEHLPGLLTAYWRLDGVEERGSLLHLFADHLVADPEGRDEVMRDFLALPVPPAEEHKYDAFYPWAQSVALAQMAGSWEVFDRCLENPELRRAAIERALVGDTPSLALLDVLEGCLPSDPQVEKEPPLERIAREVAEMVEVVEYGIVEEIQMSRPRVQPAHLPGLLAAYWRLDDWEQRARLLLLIQEYPVLQLQESEEILRHFLDGAVGGDDPDLIRETKIVALSHLIQNPWFPPHQLGKGKPRRDLIKRGLVGRKQEPNLALLEAIESGGWPPPRDEPSPPPTPAPEPATLPSKEAIRRVVGLLRSALLQVSLIDDLVRERERQQRAALPAGEPDPGPGVAEFLEAVRREDEMAVVDARYHVKPEHLPELLAAYWSLDSWEERALLMELFNDHFVTDLEGGEEVMRHFLGAPIGNKSGDIYGAAKVTTLCQLAHDWELFHQTWYNPRLRNAAVRRVLQGATPNLALLDELEADFPSPLHVKKQIEARQKQAAAAEVKTSEPQPEKEPEPAPPGPTLAELLEVARHGDEVEVREARAAMSPRVIPELLAAYGTLESWEERAGLMQLFADDLVEGGEKVMLHFLTSPLEDDYTAWGKAVALCQLAGTWELYEHLWDDRDLLEAAIERTLAGASPTPLLLHELSRQVPRSPKSSTPDPEKRWWEFWK